MPKRDLISMGDLSRAQVDLLLDTAESFVPVLQRDVKKVPTLRGRTVVGLFLEGSGRTAPSFELAAKRLSADTLMLEPGVSADVSVEALEDVAVKLSAYSPDIVVVRHPEGGACGVLAGATGASVINAGDGTNEHPTQCLADLFALRQTFGRDLAGLKVAIVGDVLHSRVAHSDIAGFRMLGVDVTLVGPPELMPAGIEGSGVAVVHDPDGLRAADVVYVLPATRGQSGAGPEYAVSAKRLQPGQRVMHPGPIDRGREIDAEVLDGGDTLVALQAFGGLAVRMAVLYRTIVGYADAVADEAV
jgi:aspartate carbamoyltransferase catalytic subunit